MGALLYSAPFIRDRPGDGERFMKAYLRAVRDYNDAMEGGHLTGRGADAIVALLAAATGTRDTRLLKAMVASACNPDGQVNVASLRADLQLFRERNLIEGEVSVDQLVDPRFVDSALKELGTYRHQP
jgi:NitT/TauT family transport system substrate-binding protein